MIAAPEIDITAGEEAGPVAFDAVVEVRPKVSIAGYEGLVVTVPALDATEEEIDARRSTGSASSSPTLNEVERPARDGDLVTVDVHGVRDGELAEGLSADDFVYEVGTGGIAEGDRRAALRREGRGHRRDRRRGRTAVPASCGCWSSRCARRCCRRPNDEWASDASEFDTLEELRSDLASRITEREAARGAPGIAPRACRRGARRARRRRDAADPGRRGGRAACSTTSPTAWPAERRRPGRHTSRPPARSRSASCRARAPGHAPGQGRPRSSGARRGRGDRGRRAGPRRRDRAPRRARAGPGPRSLRARLERDGRSRAATLGCEEREGASRG